MKEILFTVPCRRRHRTETRNQKPETETKIAPMKTLCFTLTLSGIECRNGQIVLGQSGRGRKQVTVPVPTGAEIADRIETTEVFYQCKEYSGWSDRHYIPLDQLGRYGDQWREKPDAPRRVSWTGRVVALDSQSGGVLVRIPDQSGFRGGWSAKLGPGVTRIAAGFCAQGDAGRMGGGEDLIVRMAEGSSVEILRYGRRVEPRSILKIRDGIPVITNPDAEAASAAASNALTS